MPYSDELRQKMLVFQRNEITEHHIYLRLAKSTKDPQNREVLEQIAADEFEHYQTWKEFTGAQVNPNWFKIWVYFIISRLLGITFGLMLMERGEEDAQDHYQLLAAELDQVDRLVAEEKEHEDKLLNLLDEDLLRYIGSIVLGLNDALVELTGALAGLTLALQDAKLIALTGSITGFAAALSMGASEYLSTKSEETSRKPLRAALYTGGTYLVTVILLILPYLILPNFYVSLGLTLLIAVLVIACFNYYVSVAQDQPFGVRFLEMAGISLGVAGISFLVGYLIRAVLGVEV